MTAPGHGESVAELLRPGESCAYQVKEPEHLSGVTVRLGRRRMLPRQLPLPVMIEPGLERPVLIPIRGHNRLTLATFILRA